MKSRTRWQAAIFFSSRYQKDLIMICTWGLVKRLLTLLASVVSFRYDKRGFQIRKTRLVFLRTVHIQKHNIFLHGNTTGLPIPMHRVSIAYCHIYCSAARLLQTSTYFILQLFFACFSHRRSHSNWRAFRFARFLAFLRIRSRHHSVEHCLERPYCKQCWPPQRFEHNAGKFWSICKFATHQILSSNSSALLNGKFASDLSSMTFYSSLDIVTGFKFWKAVKVVLRNTQACIRGWEKASSIPRGLHSTRNGSPDSESSTEMLTQMWPVVSVSVQELYQDGLTFYRRWQKNLPLPHFFFTLYW